MRKISKQINKKTTELFFKTKTALSNNRGAITFIEVLVMIGIVLVLAAIMYALFKEQINILGDNISKKIQEIFNYS